MSKITKQFKIDLAHRLAKDYPDKCKNVHGHSYLIEVTISSGTADNELNQYGMLLDFTDVKKSIGKWLDDNWDHATLFWNNDVEFIRFFQEMKQRIYLCSDNPTAEWMAEYLIDTFQIILDTTFDKKYIVNCVKVWETESAYAEKSR